MRLPCLPLLAALAPPLAAQAGETPCWVDAGVPVVSAEVLGIAGDFVLDTGAPQTLLADTPAQAAGFAETSLSVRVRVAGLDFENRPIRVETLDARFRGLPTPVAGVLGADLLQGHVVDVRFTPCRVRISRPAEAPAFGPALRLPLGNAGGRPVIAAGVSDGRRAFLGDFVPATGSNTAVRLRDDLVDAPQAKAREALHPFGRGRAQVRALSVADDLYERQAAGLIDRSGFEAAGELGAPVLSRYRLRFDFPAGELLLAKEKGPPDRSDGP